MKNVTKSAVALAFAGALALGVAAPASAATTENGYAPITAVKGQADRTEGAINYKGTQTVLDGDVTCEVEVFGKGEFAPSANGTTTYQSSGWIKNHGVCDDGTVYNYTIVHVTDPRWTGENPIWGSWDIIKYTTNGEG